ncbi:MAG: hypothetical protein LPJ89_04395 [Hymenobacteraceae bacterium]|nr:hypothetical protein [Hymenobacteraceae bacterium]MDX5395110.1 hypothetical protein [Hymenobacteraceae bacterium]MDX5443005.1 hypothetical protein [Hymenobacteraceae bacterium]MDX5511148.1 hypothetical protein [Hymenobacteraceae bacterium]
MLRLALLVFSLYIFFSCRSDNSTEKKTGKTIFTSKDNKETTKEISGDFTNDFTEQKFISAPLYDFYKHKEKQIQNVVWMDEPPGKLSSVLFILDDENYYEIGLGEIPEKYRFNKDLKWEMSQVGNSKIEYIIFMNGNTVVRTIGK